MTQTVRLTGPFRLHKAEPRRPRREHPTFEGAEAEARRLITLNGDDAIIIAQEVARVARND
jgi:hypothetical protein